MDEKKKTIDLGYTDEYATLGCSSKSSKKIKEKVYPTLWLRFKGEDEDQKAFSKLDLKSPIKMLVEGELISKSANTSERNGKKEENENYDIKIYKATIKD